MPATAKISFATRSGAKIVGEIVEDLGHALTVKVAEANRKIYRGRTMVFPKHDMAGLVIETGAQS